MDHTWKLTVWGVRGSFPVPDVNFLDYGGNTCCISLDRGDSLVALDAGSGLAALGEQIMREDLRRADILISHIHLDHIMGLFPFAPRYHRRMDLHLYGMPGLAGMLAHLIGPPLWPIDLADNRSRVHIHEVQDGEPFSLADGAAPGLTVTALEGSHPGGCFYYRLDGDARSLVYALDCELTGTMAQRLTAFARGAGLLIWDANYTSENLQQGWGHSTWTQGLELGQAAGVKQVLMTHYNTSCDDTFLREQEELARRASGQIRFAREGMVIEL